MKDIKLTEVELLKGENLNLKHMALVKDLRALEGMQKSLKASIEQRLDVPDLAAYEVNGQSGVGKLKPEVKS